MKKNVKISLVILNLNELESLKIILPKLIKYKKLINEIIAVDGGSKDGSKEFLKKYNIKVIDQNRKYSNFEISILKKNIVDSYWIGIKKAKFNNGIIPFTPDGNMLPKYLPNLIKKIKQGYDMVIVSRYKDKAKSHDDTLVTGFGNYMFTKIVNILFGGNFTDLMGGYRCVSKNLFKEFKINKSNLTIAIHTQLAIGCIRNKKSYVEISGDEPKRIAGAAQVNPLINGLWEVYIILQAFFVKNLYRSKK